MDFNQTAKETLTRVQSELAQGKDKIEWTVYIPIPNLDEYRKEQKNFHGFRAYIRLIAYTLLLAFALTASGLPRFWIGLIVIAFVAWHMWENQKDRKEALAREYFDYRYNVNFKKKKYVLFVNGIECKPAKFHKQYSLPEFNLPEPAMPSEIAQRDTLQCTLAQIMGVEFVSAA